VDRAGAAVQRISGASRARARQRTVRLYPTRDAFGPVGKFLATYGHRQICASEAAPALFTEPVAQICWFYFGPHLRNRRGRLPRRVEPGYLPPEQRPYPEQMVVAFPDDLLARFTAGWEETLA